jgi:folate-binding protein YgfZ
LAGVLERLAKHVIADDVVLRDASGELARLALEGPASPAIADAAQDDLAAAKALVLAYGVSGEAARQVFAPAAEAERLYQALLRAGRPHGLVEAGAEALEILRIESGTPRQGRELSEEVLPQEAGLDAAICTSKGCYTGQEVVARVRTYGQVKHRLVGLRVEGGDPPAPGTALEVDGARVGEVTSAALSPQAGAIALGYVRRPHDEPDTILRGGSARVRVARLPLVEPSV